MNDDIKTPSPTVKSGSPDKPLVQLKDTEPEKNNAPTPDATNKDDEISVDMSKDSEVFVDGEAAEDKSKSKKSHWWARKISKKQAIIMSVVLVLLIGGGTVFALTRKKPAPQAAVVQEPPKPTTEPSKLTGLQVDPSYNKLPVTGVMIENSIFARPQSGLNQAGIVFEAIAEGGITRFLALYQDTKPKYIGPIRSARPYYLEWALPFQAALAHVGGSPDALNDIKNWGVRNLDQFANAGAYQRITAREAPHNVYTSLDKLLALQKSKGYKSSSFTSFLRKADAPAKLPTAKTIDFSISGPDYSVHYVYNKKANNYLRSVGGAKHLDEKSKKQLAPKVVIALIMSYRLASDAHHSVYGTDGSGYMYIFQDGKVTKGTWKKTNKYAQFQFLDSGAKPIAINAGQTWITALGAKTDVKYKP